MPYLVLIRHGQSEWNAKNLFTGWEDPDLTELGVAEARSAGVRLSQLGIHFDLAWTSALQRAQKTLNLVLAELGQTPPITKNEKLNERAYGDLTGMDKDQARAKWGAEQVTIWRRSYDIPPPRESRLGESLKDTAERVLPYYEQEILPQLAAGKNILIAAHGNSLRALVMQLEQLTPEQILQVEIGTGKPLVYELAADGQTILSKQVLD